MKNITKQKSHDLRRERNANILRRMNNGDPLTAFNSVSSWFPPRPIIKKDEEHVEALYGVSLDRRLSHDDELVEGDDMSHEKKPNPMRIA